MPQSLSCRSLAVALGALCLLAPAAQARHAPRPQAPAGVRVWKLALSFFTPWAVPLVAATKEGCSADPDGRCKAAPLTPPTWGAGCSADPIGCGAVPNTENGCSADPGGRCLSGH
jgi:hypothetical protein